ncbi:MAG: hypothetical protein H6732_03825 [Alphaproteobacteria bacterium]|nr:hypothetical protein [Alphaproteobacteria bacterium]
MRRWLWVVVVTACGPAGGKDDVDTDVTTDSGDSDVGDSGDSAPPDTDPPGRTGLAPVATAVTPDGLALVGQAVRVEVQVADPDGDTPTVAWAVRGVGARLVELDATHVVVIPRGVGALEVEALPSDAEGPGTPAVVRLQVHDLDVGLDHGLGLKPDGTVLAWGDNTNGMLGDGTHDARPAAGPVCAPGATDCTGSPLTDQAAVAAGLLHSLSLGRDGRVWAWGDNIAGQLGDGTLDERLTPVPVCDVGASDCAADPLTGVVAVAAGAAFSLALRDDGTVLAWGANDDHQLGDGTTEVRRTPVEVCGPGPDVGPCTGALDGVVAIAAGRIFSLALREDGRVWSWGSNAAGQLGRGVGELDERAHPVLVCGVDEVVPCDMGLQDVLVVDAGSTHTFAVRQDGLAFGWGRNGEGELATGHGETTCGILPACVTSPVVVCSTAIAACTDPFRDLAQVEAGLDFSVALRQDGTVWSFGANQESQLGDGTFNRRRAPVQVCGPDAARPCTAFLDDVAGIAVGAYHTVALRQDGTVWGWGDNPFAVDPDQLPNTNPVPARLPGW